MKYKSVAINSQIECLQDNNLAFTITTRVGPVPKFDLWTLEFIPPEQSRLYFVGVAKSPAFGNSKFPAYIPFKPTIPNPAETLRNEVGGWSGTNFWQVQFLGARICVNYKKFIRADCVIQYIQFGKPRRNLPTVPGELWSLTPNQTQIIQYGLFNSYNEISIWEPHGSDLVKLGMLS